MAELGKVTYEVKIKHVWMLYFTVGIHMLFGYKGFIPKCCVSCDLLRINK